MPFNFGNWMNENVFRTNEMKQITSGVGSILGKGMNLFDGLTSNILNMSKGLTNMISSPFLMPLLLIGGSIFIMVRLKVL